MVTLIRVRVRAPVYTGYNKHEFASIPVAAAVHNNTPRLLVLYMSSSYLEIRAVFVTVPLFRHENRKNGRHARKF